MSLLKVSSLFKSGKNGWVIQNLEFTQKRFQKLGIAGETGSGKSTLLKMIAGLVQPDAGIIFFEDEQVLGPLEKLIPGHPSIAYLSQHFELRNNYFVREELEAVNLLSEKEAATIYSLCRIDHLLDRKTNELSGGERQRIALARLIVKKPALLLLDEPFSHLDYNHKMIMKEVVEDISEKAGITCILVSHHGSELLSWVDELIILRHGKILQKDRPSVIYKQPANEYAAGLLGDYNFIPKNQLSLFGISEKVKNGIIIRPEQIMISSNEGKWNGVVKQSHFQGSHWLLNLQLPQIALRVICMKNKYSTGDTVSISFDPQDVWPV